MSTLRRNIRANLLGNIWSAVLSIAAIPCYVHFMGVESFALVGIFTTLLMLFSILDLGLSTTITREVARLSAMPGSEQDIRDLFWTMEVITWVTAVLIGTAVLVLSYPIAFGWIKPGHLSNQSVQETVILMGMAIVFQWPYSFYSSALTGLQKMAPLNILSALFMSLRVAGSVMVLWLLSPTGQAFFIFQIFINIVQATVFALYLRYRLPQAGRTSIFRLDLIRSVWQFAAGMGGITVLNLVWSQLDKVILSKLLPLELFGYYTLAGIAATGFSRLMGPLVSAVFPRFTQLITANDQEKLRSVFHESCQLMSIMIIPVALFLAFFPFEIMLLWTQSVNTAAHTRLLVSLLAISTMLNGLVHIPLSLGYAHGLTRQPFYIILLLLVCMVPAMLLLTHSYGAIGAAVTLVMINLVFTIVVSKIYFATPFEGERKCWYVQDIGYPMLASLLVISFGRAFISGNETLWILVSGLAVVAALTLAAASLAAPLIRARVLLQLDSLHKRISYEV